MDQQRRDQERGAAADVPAALCRDVEAGHAGRVLRQIVGGRHDGRDVETDHEGAAGVGKDREERIAIADRAQHRDTGQHGERDPGGARDPWPASIKRPRKRPLIAPATAAMAMAPPKAWKLSPSEMKSARFQTKSSPQAIQPSAMNSSTPGKRGPEGARRLLRHHDIGRPEQRHGRAEQHNGRGPECDARTQRYQRPAREQRGCDADRSRRWPRARRSAGRDVRDRRARRNRRDSWSSRAHRRARKRQSACRAAGRCRVPRARKGYCRPEPIVPAIRTGLRPTRFTSGSTSGRSRKRPNRMAESEASTAGTGTPTFRRNTV